jgi:hypothetical protein
MSILAEQIRKKHEVSKEFLQTGFEVASEIGELFSEVENLVGAENFETWLKENKLKVTLEGAQKYMKLSRGEKISLTLEVHREQNQENNQENELETA